MQFQNVVGENRLNLRVGTVGTQTMGLFTARDANFYGTHYYLYTSWLMPTPDRALPASRSSGGTTSRSGRKPASEVNGFGERWFYAGGIVNGD